MTSMGIYEAKSKLSALCEKARAGEEIVITRNGIPVAKLVSPDSPNRKEALNAVRAIHDFRKNHLLRSSSHEEIVASIRGSRR